MSDDTHEDATVPPASTGSLAWIPVERLPPSHTDSVWVFDGTDVFMAEYWPRSGFMSCGAGGDRDRLNSERIRGVTHWMEIAEPAPPTDAKSPTLTDAEREAIRRNTRHDNGMWLMHVPPNDQAIIDGLLERTK